MSKLLLITAIISSLLQADKLICYSDTMTIQGKNISLEGINPRSRVSVYYTTKDTLVIGDKVLPLRYTATNGLKDYVGKGIRVVLLYPSMTTLKDGVQLNSHCIKDSNE